MIVHIIFVLNKHIDTNSGFHLKSSNMFINPGKDFGLKLDAETFFTRSNMSWQGVMWCVTRPISRSLVSMTTIVELCSHNILQKSSVVSDNGPWVAM